MAVPALVVGLGGTGVKALTYAKQDLMRNNDGVVPPEVTLLAFDTTSKVESWWHELRVVTSSGRSVPVRLESKLGEYVHIGGWSKPFVEISVAVASGGSMRDAMSAFDQVIAFSGDEVRDEDVVVLLGLVGPAGLARTARALAANDVDAVLQVVSELVESGQDLQNFCRRLLGHIRNLMVLRAGVSDPGVLGVPESLIPDLKQQAELFSREDLLRLFDACVKIELELKYSNQPRFQLEMGLVELSPLARLRPLEEVIEDFRRQIGSGAVVPDLPPVAVPQRPPAAPPSRGDVPSFMKLSPSPTSPCPLLTSFL